MTLLRLSDFGVRFMGKDRLSSTLIPFTSLKLRVDCCFFEHYKISQSSLNGQSIIEKLAAGLLRNDMFAAFYHPQVFSFQSPAVSRQDNFQNKS